MNVFVATSSDMESTLPPLNPLLKTSGKRTWDVFASYPDDSMKDDEKRCVSAALHREPGSSLLVISTRIRLSVKINDEYRDVKELPAPLLAQQGQVGPARPKEQRKMITAGRTYLTYPSSALVHIMLLSHIRCLTHYRTNRQHTNVYSVNIHLQLEPYESAAAAQDNPNYQTDIPPAVEAYARDLGAPGLGTQCRSGAR